MKISHRSKKNQKPNYYILVIEVEYFDIKGIYFFVDKKLSQSEVGNNYNIPSIGVSSLTTENTSNG